MCHVAQLPQTPAPRRGPGRKGRGRREGEISINQLVEIRQFSTKIENCTAALGARQGSLPRLKTPAEKPGMSGLDTGLLAAVAAGEARLTPDQCLEMLRGAPTHTMGRWG